MIESECFIETLVEDVLSPTCQKVKISPFQNELRPEFRAVEKKFGPVLTCAHLLFASVRKKKEQLNCTSKGVRVEYSTYWLAGLMHLLRASQYCTSSRSFLIPYNVEVNSCAVHYCSKIRIRFCFILPEASHQFGGTLRYCRLFSKFSPTLTLLPRLIKLVNCICWIHPRKFL